MDCREALSLKIHCGPHSGGWGGDGGLLKKLLVNSRFFWFCLCFLFCFKIYLIILKTVTERTILWPSHPKWPQQPALGWTEDRSQEPSHRSPTRVTVAQRWAILRCFFQSISKEMDGQCSSQDTNWHLLCDASHRWQHGPLYHNTRSQVSFCG